MRGTDVEIEERGEEGSGARRICGNVLRWIISM